MNPIIEAITNIDKITIFRPSKEGKQFLIFLIIYIVTLVR
nr:MAG TPA: hypothetical protein [Caudoviricetes sp.]